MIEKLPIIDPTKMTPVNEAWAIDMTNVLNILIIKINELTDHINESKIAYSDLEPLIRHFRED